MIQLDENLWRATLCFLIAFAAYVIRETLNWYDDR